MSEIPLSGEEIRNHLAEVADALAPGGIRHELILVGGSLLAWHGLRDATRDVDTIRRIDDELRGAVATVAVRYGLAPRWLNDEAAAFRPQTLSPDACVTLLEHGRLLVRAAPMDQVFLMKLLAARAQDYDDMVSMWPLTGFVSAAEANDQFKLAYPHVADDEHLIEYIQGIADQSQSSG